jgi:[protein-PII] uridylyltransferase
MLNETIQSALTESELLTDVLLHDKLVQESKPISTARKAIAEAQDVLNRLYKEGFQITPLVQARAWVIDRILTSLWQRTFSSDEPLSLIAVGGYGRGELHPWSDIDLLVLVEKEISTELGEKITPFITLLWDLKLDIGHSVRTMDECIAAAEEDITIETNLLETRCIAGPKELEQKLIRRIYSDEIYTDRAYFVAKREEQNQRHQKYSDTEYNLEPNIKSSPGTLRDIQTIGWITKRHFGVSSTQELIRSNFLTREEFETLNQGEKFLWELRYGLQMLAGRNENRLLFDYQRKLAELLGYEDNEESLGVEIMMHHYYRVVMEISELTELILQHFDEAILRADQPEEVLPLNKRFQLRNRYIEVTHDKVFNWAPYAMIELFLLIAQNPQIKGIRASTIRLLRFHFRDINDDFRNDLANTSLFMELLKTPHALDKTLNDMKRYHILENYLPEFGLIIGQMQHDLFHSYTVDAHTLRVIRNMVELRSSKKTQ